MKTPTANKLLEKVDSLLTLTYQLGDAIDKKNLFVESQDYEAAIKERNKEDALRKQLKGYEGLHTEILKYLATQ